MSTFPAPIKVRVPATSANLGPGFDTLGLALNIYNFIEIGPATGDRDQVTTSGIFAPELPQDETNIALGAARQLLRRLGAPATPLHLHLENHIPFARGLGSSAAARVGALVAAQAWAQRAYGCAALDPDEPLALATQMEGHPDNAAAALLGGLVVSASEEDGTAVAMRVPVETFPRLLVFIPRHELATSEARRVLPANVPRADANFNVARSSLLVAALAGQRWELLPCALQDRLHQPARAALLPGFEALAAVARENGAFGVTLSGAGPSMLIWLPAAEEVAARVQRVVQETAAICGVAGEVRTVTVDTCGCTVLE